MSEILGFYPVNAENIAVVQKDLASAQSTFIITDSLHGQHIPLTDTKGVPGHYFHLDTHTIHPNVLAALQTDTPGTYIRKLFHKEGDTSQKMKARYSSFLKTEELTLSNALAQQTGLCAQQASLYKLAHDDRNEYSAFVQGTVFKEGELILHAWNLAPNPKRDQFKLADVITGQTFNTPSFILTTAGYLIGQRLENGTFYAPYTLGDRSFLQTEIKAPYIEVPAGMKRE